MQTTKEKVKISAGEIAQTLQWPYTTVISIINRNSPADKLKIITDCAAALRESKEKIQATFQNPKNQ